MNGMASLKLLKAKKVTKQMMGWASILVNHFLFTKYKRSKLWPSNVPT